MPLLWKKARISRIVADLQSPKRGGSLVVETGFPTSLIDLFFKNRDRLRKTKNNNNKENDDVDAENDNRRVDPIPAAGPEIPRVLVEQNSSDSIQGGSTVAVRTSGPDVFAAATIGALTVAVLALSTKKLAIAVTLSAFALFLAEFVMKRLVRRRSGGDHESESVSVSVLGSDSEEEFIAARVPAAIRFADEVLLLRPNLEQLSRDESDQATSGLLDKSKRAKIRRKIIKNLVPKKLRSISKKKRKKANLRTLLEEVGEGAEESVKDDDGEQEQEQEQELGRYWAFVVLLGVVLLGLCWGRIFALLLTLVWCFVMKLTGFIRKLLKALRQISS